MLALLALFAYSLLDAQSTAREDLEERFDERANVSAAVTRAIFAVSEQSVIGQAADQLGGAEVSQRAIDRFARRSQLLFLEVLDDQGKRLGATEGIPGENGQDPHVQQALRTGKTVFSNLEPGGQGMVAEWAAPFKTPSGQQRVIVEGVSAKLLAGFLESFLKGVPQPPGGESFVIDSRNVEIGGPQSGTPLENKALAAALREGANGKYEDGGERYFTSSGIEGTPWKVVLTSSTEELYEPVSGSRRTVPWIIFATLGLTALAGLFLLRRVVAAQGEIERRKLNQRHAMEINDNIIQRLVLAKYALDRGSEEMSQEKLSETLQEAQRLVSGLLEEHPEAGSLRREAPAEIGSERERESL